jgi:hypothetical protein
MDLRKDLDEGQWGDQRALQLADIRAAVRAMISEKSGYLSWVMADRLGKAQVPTMCAATIINFATGKTRIPNTTTIRTLSAVVGYRAVLIPMGTKLPKGSLELK